MAAEAREPEIPAGKWPSGHLAWIFSGIGEFQGAVTTFLAEGAARGERLVLVADDPKAELWPRYLLSSGTLIVASTSEVYGSDRLVVADTQRDRFTAMLQNALDEGYSGIRVAADNTSLVAGGERLSAWKRWEEVADRFMAENPVTGLCAFDRSRTDPERIKVLEGLHRVTVVN